MIRISHQPWALYYRAVLLWIYQQPHNSIKCGSREQLCTCYLKIKLLPRKLSESSKTFLWLTFFATCGKGRDKERNLIFLFLLLQSDKNPNVPHQFRSHSYKCGCRLTSFWRGKESLGEWEAFKNICYVRLKDGIRDQDLSTIEFNLRFNILKKTVDFSCLLAVDTCHYWVSPPPRGEQGAFNHISANLTWVSFLKNMAVSMEAPHLQKCSSHRMVATWYQRYLIQIYKAKAFWSKLTLGQVKRPPP